MLVHMEFELQYFSADSNLIITEKTQASCDIWLSVMLLTFYNDAPKMAIRHVMKGRYPLKISLCKLTEA